MDHPEPLQELQRAYVEAGSQIVYAPTFAATLTA
ncbi:MAG: homocysteine S-methyltransferase family protein [Lachnospiraceae bacterium]